MGRVQSSLVLNDQMSKVLGRINKAMGLTLNSFEAVQRASGKSFNSAAIRAARREIGAADAALKEIMQDYQNCNNQQQRLNRHIGQGTSAAGGLLGKIKGIASAYLGMKGLSGLVGLSDTITQTNARLSMMNDGLQTTAELNDMIYASAQRSRGSYLATADAVAKLGLMAGDAFSSNKETVAFMEQVNKQFKIAGTSAAGIDAAMLQLTQAMGSGVLRGEEYNSILEQAPNIIQAIAKHLDVPKGQLKEMAADGKITADIVKAAMFACADETNAKFESIPKTWSDIWTSMKNRAIKALDPVLAKINQLANSERVQRTVNGLLKAFSVMAVVLAAVFDGVCAVYNFVADNWSRIGPIIMGVVGALLIYKTAVLVIKAIETIAAVTKGIFAAATKMQAGATLAATATQYGLNTAIWACPITWVIALIIVLIVLIAVFYEEVMGAVYGTSYWVGALFKNIGLWIANLTIAIWNSLKNIGLWIANRVTGSWNVIKASVSNIGIAFSNAWVDIQTGFWYCLNNIMQGIKRLAETANTCLGWMGVNIDTSGLDFAAKKLDSLNGKRQEYQSLADAFNEGNNTYEVNWGKDWQDGYSTFDVFKSGWGSEAYGAGSAYGTELARNFKANIKGIFDDILGTFNDESNNNSQNTDYENNLKKISDNTGDTAKNTSKSAEELSYLRDIAEREAINRFTTAEVRVELGGVTNNVASGTDLDGVISYLADGLSEALVTAAEGVY